MKSLTPTLLAAQKQTGSLPYVRAVISDHYGDVPQLRFARHYDDAEADYFSAAAGTGDAALVRAHIDSTTHVLYSQRVPEPGPESDFSAWTSHGTVSALGAVALAAHEDDVLLFYVDADGVNLKLKVSDDNGQTYGSAATVATAMTPARYLAAAVSSTGERVLFWVEGADVYSSRYSGGVWSERTAWAYSATSISGLACHHRLDFNLVICGRDAASGDAKVWTCVFGDGVELPEGDWGPLAEVTTASAGSDVSFSAPALTFLQHWRLFFVETYEGSQPYTRLQWSTMAGGEPYGSELWREPIAFDYEGPFGVAATARNLDGYLWLSSPAGVWSARSPSIDALDVSADVIEAIVDAGEQGGRAQIALSNHATGSALAGRYAHYGSNGLSAIGCGARLELAPGYVSSNGAEAALGSHYWVEAIELTSGPAPRIVLRARDAWWLLERWRARRQFVWTADTRSVSQILQFVCARAGLKLASISTSDAITGLQPAFTIHPGDSGFTAVRRLMAMVPDVLFVQGSTLISRLPLADDDTSYVYERPGLTASTQHCIAAATYRELEPTVNRARVVGDGIYYEALDFEAIESGGERVSQVVDLNLSTEEEASDRAAVDLRYAAVRARDDEIRVFGVNCGQEIYDVVSITDPYAGLDDAARRVLGLSWRYQTGAAGGQSRYDMTLRLGNP